MYQHIIDKIIELGDSLVIIAGSVENIAKNKDWLTEKDTEIEIELGKIINTIEGKHSIYAEGLNDTYVDNENVWIIDPISNTFNFIHGLPHYTIILSHVAKGSVVFGVVYDPSTKELFTAQKGKGAYLNSKKIIVSDSINDLVVLVGPHLTPTSPYRAEALTILKDVSLLGTVRTFGSVGLHYAYVACGRAEVAITKNHDTYPEFAGKLLVEEAGGKFTDFSGNQLRNTTCGILASNGKVHDIFLKVVSK